MVSVSVAPLLLSAMVTPTNGLTAASAAVGCAAVVTVMVGSAASVSVTVMVLLLALVPAELKSLSVKVVVVTDPAAPTVGEKTRLGSSELMVVGDPARVWGKAGAHERA